MKTIVETLSNSTIPAKEADPRKGIALFDRRTGEFQGLVCKVPQSGMLFIVRYTGHTTNSLFVTIDDLIKRYPEFEFIQIKE